MTLARYTKPYATVAQRVQHLRNRGLGSGPANARRDQRAGNARGGIFLNGWNCHPHQPVCGRLLLLHPSLSRSLSWSARPGPRDATGLHAGGDRDGVRGYCRECPLGAGTAGRWGASLWPGAEATRCRRFFRKRGISWKARTPPPALIELGRDEGFRAVFFAALVAIGAALVGGLGAVPVSTPAEAAGIREADALLKRVKSTDQRCARYKLRHSDRHHCVDSLWGRSCCWTVVSTVCRALPMTWEILERAKGFEPSTPTLARLCSTPELRPLWRLETAALASHRLGEARH